MNEIYWLTRLDGINAIAITLVVISVIASAISLIGYFVCLGNISYYTTREYEENIEEWTRYKTIWKKIWVVFVPLLIIFTSVRVFTPTTNEAFVIYGIGGTIDYVKSNPTAKQLPDKCIKALDRWMDNLGVEKTDSVHR